MFYQLKSFDENLPDSVIATQAGLMASSFTGAQFLTAMMWGRISDSEKGGRKLVLLIGLFGTGMWAVRIQNMIPQSLIPEANAV
jgi:MFS family permease